MYNVIDLRFKFYRDNIRLFNKYKNINWNEYDIQNYNSIGFLFENINQYDSALKYYNIGLEVAERNKSEVWYGLMSGNMGIIYLKLKNYQKAESLLLIDLKTSKKIKNYESALNVMFELIDIKNHQKNMMMQKIF
ncbi:MAG: tetratricopeptide repeat protein [bacterium]